MLLRSWVRRATSNTNHVKRSFSKAANTNPTLSVVFEDTDFMFLSKESGSVMVGTNTEEVSVIDWVRKEYGGERFRPSLLASTERACSGLVVFGKHRAAEKHWELIKARNSVIQGFIVGVTGNVQPNHGKIKAGIMKTPKDYRRFSLVRRGGREMELDYYCVKKFDWAPLGTEVKHAAVLAINDRTHRQHHVRAACSALHVPILGDTMYGGEEWPIPLYHTCYFKFPKFLQEDEYEVISLPRNWPTEFTIAAETIKTIWEKEFQKEFRIVPIGKQRPQLTPHSNVKTKVTLSK